MLTVDLNSAETVVKARCRNIVRELPHPKDRDRTIRSTHAVGCTGPCPSCRKLGPTFIYMLEDNDTGATHAVDCPTCCSYVFFTATEATDDKR
jgi:hypothetical protein